MKIRENNLLEGTKKKDIFILQISFPESVKTKYFTKKWDGSLAIPLTWTVDWRPPTTTIWKVAWLVQSNIWKVVLLVPIQFMKRQ